MIDLQTIYEANERIKDVIVKTPFGHAPRLSQESGCNVYLKKENLQVTGAFKIRGAYNKIASLSDEERSRGVIAASAGNHAQGVAMAAQMFGTRALIVMPESTPLTKINGVSYYGAEVILAGSNYDEAYAYASSYGAEHGLVFVHPFADEAVMAGQGTLALEMLECMDNLDAIIIPVGGGGLISGMASAIKALAPHIRVIGVGAAGAPAMRQSFDAKTAIDTTSVRTIADGIAVRDTSPITLAHILDSVDEFVSVDDEEIANAILFLLERQKLVVEGAGAAGVAALLHHKMDHLKDKNVGVVLSGGNMDVTLLSIIIEKGLIKSGRKMKLTVTLIDKPGTLMQLTRMLQDLNANIVHIEYDRTSTSLAYGDANVTIHLETKGEAHQQQIRSALKDNRYLISEEH
ncbi:MAG: threonine ammonia-lyase [Sulfuricurvum sp. PD_MW2]|uniref:threonine ammonia-lyase n=1 Tax=Sulfuricurvum sp. PD_MW2 TaxID=2027917 RepID=UPI000C0658D3|nr:threonine ammonia-lyase [Sulfuricurvum sp. PD_MW2]PHM17372.1 MAG: threonine ammonia-lyase [Sulfuricurvum sp. PD_MW2]